MNGRHDSRRPEDWLKFAKADLDTASHMLRTMEPCPYWIVSYHAQQCAEKALKGYLISLNKQYPYTHDLRLLLDKCEACGAKWVEGVRGAEKIMSFSVMERYPSTTRTVTKDEASLAVTVAGDVLRAVTDSIQDSSNNRQ